MFGKWKKQKPKARDLSGPVVDLDAISRDPVHFQFQGAVHEIRPITVEEFLNFTNANARFIERLKSSESMTGEELIAAYAQVIGTVCSSIGEKEIAAMEQAQVAALYQLVIDTVTGHVKTGEAQKKRAQLGLYEPPKSSPTAADSSAGQ